ncbi:MAG: hypothetical protein PUK76_07065 [Treponema sp.]|nr:hypothetical protein [Spirochaetia bacterium]MDD7450791.1 hypothetical protein [Treponema sp.]MDY2924833.1 hypothetical protein [Treponema sp.]MDY5682517.1 hypothetical protein [Treponema sp.]
MKNLRFSKTGLFRVPAAASSLRTQSFPSGTLSLAVAGKAALTIPCPL